MRLQNKGFTLIELMVVVTMIAILMGAVGSAATGAMKRARIQKATSEVKAIHQAILAYENYDENSRLDPVDGLADVSSLGFLIGNGGTTRSGEKIPSLLMAQLSAGGQMLDPWNRPYRVKIKPGNGSIKLESTFNSLNTGIYPPNMNRLSAEERK